MMLAQRLELPELLGRLLAARGLAPDTAADFLDPRLRVFLPDPSVLIDMDKAAARLARAVRAREQVAVFADYDVDGACSGALMVQALRRYGCQVAHYVPDRLKEGYGPNAPAIAALCEAGATLIVCVDCGIAAHQALEAARGRAEVVILDHHKAEGPPPPVLAAVNPNRLDCPSGLKGLCAGGVAFLALVATQRELRRGGFFEGGAEPDLMAMLDIVALATVCDVMPLTGVNRALVTQGIKILAKRGRPGLAALMEVAGARGEVSAHTLGFTLGPRINAGGRIAEPDLGLRLLLSEEPAEARAIAEKLDAVNRRRQEVEAGVLTDAMTQGEAQLAAGRGVLLVRGQGWHPGVVGIVASRLKEKFNRPACVAGIDDGIAKGSGRSVTGLDLGSAVIWARSSGLLIAGGGHAMAAGFTCEESRLEEFHALLEERLAGAAELPAASELLLDGALTVRAATVEMAGHIARLAPFGAGNEEPVFVLRRCRIVKADRVGAEGQVVRAFLEGEDGGRLKAVCFRAKEGPLAGLLLGSGGAPLHLAGHLRAERWNDQVSAGFQIVDGCRA
ncbi:single-stranded-DNA-specific exonuclease RecJ [Rhodovarius lipocyclicus]|uniref:single-stranded-DNA-specific exonuclease RecJ n=1 Tax=Rhodovarius lipocyclicus TaxID=268410 RepID=UPI00135C1296|nr:single-stranded-DNA-specific exonuclease RecJ [Rhodovarius lipocyclicus]